MQYIIEHADEIEKLIKVKAQVSEVKSIMLDNIDKVCPENWNCIQGVFGNVFGNELDNQLITNQTIIQMRIFI